MNEPYKWKLSPSKFEASKGCPCFSEEQSFGKKFKDRGTDLHELVEKEDMPLDGLEAEDRDAVVYCREYLQEVRELLCPIVEAKELLVQASEIHPRGKLDYTALTGDGLLLVLDWKFGVQPIEAKDNPQFEAYALMAYHHFIALGHQINRIMVGPVQPALDSHPTEELSIEDLTRIEADLKKANDRVTDPVKLPDASDTGKCARCAYLLKCPAVTRGLSKVVEGFGLPIPSSFDPGALVDDRTRVIAQDLAVLLSGWADLVKSKNKEYALANGGTIAGIYNVTTRGNGTEITDIPGFVDGLWRAGLIQHPMDILPYMKIKKTALVDALVDNPERDKEATLATIKDLETTHGTARPPVSVFRRGGKKQVKEAEAMLDIPMLQLPEGWK